MSTDEKIRDTTVYDAATLNKVYRGLFRSGLTYEQARDAVSGMQNEGVLFREAAA